MSGKALALALASAASLFAQLTDIPFVPTPPEAVNAMLDLAAIKPDDVLLDLGSGDGRIVIAAAKRFGIRAIGVEIDPELVRKSQETARLEGVASKTTFVAADLFQCDLSQASVVTTFLTPGFNLRLRPRFLKQLRPGSRIVTYRFEMGNWAPAKTIRVNGEPIYLWIVPNAGTPAPAAAPAAPPAPSFDKLAAMFSYDAAAPLDVHTEDPVPADGASTTPLSYAGARSPVSATLVTPSRKGRYPAVVFMPDYGKRDEFLPEALSLARAPSPFVSLLIDAPPERPVGWRRNFNSLDANDNDRDIHVQAVIDIRRGIDLLAKRSDVDASRIAYVGHGYGANWGAILASLDRRLRAYVLVAGFPSFSELIDGDDPDWANLRYGLGPERTAHYRESISAVDPIRYVKHWTGAPVLFQFGRFDTFVSRSMADRFAKSAPTSRRALFYDAGHSVNDPKAIADRTEFLNKSTALHR